MVCIFLGLTCSKFIKTLSTFLQMETISVAKKFISLSKKTALGDSS